MGASGEYDVRREGMEKRDCKFILFRHPQHIVMFEVAGGFIHESRDGKVIFTGCDGGMWSIYFDLCCML